MKKTVLSFLLVYIPAGAVLLSILLVLLLKWVPVTTTPLMLKRSLQSIGEKGISVKYKWMSIEEISDEMIFAVIAAEDQSFFQHEGFDYQEIWRMKQKHLFDGSPVRGCSTISQQTAKNCFTWCTKTWLRKITETYFTVLIEKIWGKKRILEVYLNVAEMGPGIYGAEASARKYYQIHASDLTMADASSLVCCLPNPLHRDPNWVNQHMAARRAQIAKDASLRLSRFYSNGPTISSIPSSEGIDGCRLGYIRHYSPSLPERISFLLSHPEGYCQGMRFPLCYP